MILEEDLHQYWRG